VLFASPFRSKRFAASWALEIQRALSICASDVFDTKKNRKKKDIEGCGFFKKVFFLFWKKPAPESLGWPTWI